MNIVKEMEDAMTSEAEKTLIEAASKEMTEAIKLKRKIVAESIAAEKKDRKDLREKLIETRTKARDGKNPNAGTSQSRLIGLKRQYRIKHVAFCLARGKKYLEIEPVVRKGNEIFWFDIKDELKARLVFFDLKNKFSFDNLKGLKHNWSGEFEW